MVNNSEHLIRIRGKLRQVYPYAGDEVIEDMATRMVNCVPELKQNLYEWEEGKALTDIYIRGKYSIAAVLCIRNEMLSDMNFVDAFISLNRYAVDESDERFLWRRVL